MANDAQNLRTAWLTRLRMAPSQLTQSWITPAITKTRLALEAPARIGLVRTRPICN